MAESRFPSRTPPTVQDSRQQQGSNARTHGSRMKDASRHPRPSFPRQTRQGWLTQARSWILSYRVARSVSLLPATGGMRKEAASTPASLMIDGRCELVML